MITEHWITRLNGANNVIMLYLRNLAWRKTCSRTLCYITSLCFISYLLFIIVNNYFLLPQFEHSLRTCLVINFYGQHSQLCNIQTFICIQQSTLENSFTVWLLSAWTIEQSVLNIHVRNSSNNMSRYSINLPVRS